jgi:hypothetical protein
VSIAGRIHAGGQQSRDVIHISSVADATYSKRNGTIKTSNTYVHRTSESSQTQKGGDRMSWGRHGWHMSVPIVSCALLGCCPPPKT